MLPRLSTTPRLNYNARRQTHLPEWAREWLESNPWWTWEAVRAVAIFAIDNDKVEELRSLAEEEYGWQTAH